VRRKRDVSGTVTFEAQFVPNAIGMTATVSIEPEDDADDDDDGMPPSGGRTTRPVPGHRAPSESRRPAWFPRQRHLESMLLAFGP
jgi:hypothetical protein